MSFPGKLPKANLPCLHLSLRYTANGISSDGLFTLNLNLGLLRDFSWRFIIANVDKSIIYYGLLVDMRQWRLIDFKLFVTEGYTWNFKVYTGREKINNLYVSEKNLLKKLNPKKTPFSCHFTFQ